MMMNIPSCLFLQIRDYFVTPYGDDYNDRESWRNFLHCNKWLYQEIRRNYDIHFFSVELSVAYITRQNPVYNLLNKIIYDQVQVIMTHLVMSPSLQLFLSFTKEEVRKKYRSVLHEIWGEIYANIHHLRDVYGIIQCPNHYFDFVRDFSFLDKIPYTSYPCSPNYYQNFTDFPSLNVDNQHIISLHLTNSYSLEGLSDLKKLSSLQLTHNFEGNNINRFLKFAKIASLPNLRHLKVINCLQSLNVSYFRNIHDLEIHTNGTIVDVKPLANVFRLKLLYCLGIMDVSSLKNVYDLDITGCVRVTDISSLSKVTLLNITDLTMIARPLPAERLTCSMAYFSHLKWISQEQKRKIDLIIIIDSSVFFDKDCF
jgi:hypothetical protein